MGMYILIEEGSAHTYELNNHNPRQRICYVMPGIFSDNCHTVLPYVAPVRSADRCDLFVKHLPVQA